VIDAIPSWQILTGEYPPQPGGVSDYTQLLAAGLAADGADVTVWAPPCEAPAPFTHGRVTVHRLPDCFGARSLRAIDAHLRTLPHPRRILVQYVPHAFGRTACFRIERGCQLKDSHSVIAVRYGRRRGAA